ncbi:MAG TPA: efflux transporter outer membrane subunit [Magnetospirillaceae bacterium]|nr:efflux transporter outer membrane subunit [Magnetospirillaceae bacterium]
MKRLFLLLPLVLAGCWSVGPDYQQPAMPETGNGFNAAQAPAVSADAPPERWWESFADPTLNQLIERAVAGNYDLKVATANLQAAQAARDVAGAAQFPKLDASASLDRARESAATQLGNAYIAAPDVNLTQVAGTLSWELDLFGRVRRQVEAADADSAQAEALRRQVLIVTIAQVAATYIDLRGAQLRLDVATQNAQVQRDTYQLTVTLSDAGRGTDLDVARARAQLETTLATIPPLRAELAADKHQLALLTGQPPAALSALLEASAPLPKLPAFLPVGDPGAMLRRRPDVAAAERGLAGATARIGVATADLFPTISFTAAPSLQALQPGDLAKKGAFGYSIGPSLSLPIFDLSVYARLRAANANERASLASFEKAVLNALAETETALDTYAQDRQRRQSLSAAAEASGRAADLASTRYQAGIENFLAVLDAEARKLAAEDQQAQSEIAVTEDLVTIYRALGGGWTIAP